MENVLQSDDNLFREDPIEFLSNRSSVDGDFTEAQLFGHRVLIATSRTAVREMLNDERGRLTIYDQNPRQHRELFGSSIFSANGDDHVRTRALLTSCLVTKRQLRRYLPSLHAICESHVRAWDADGVDDLFAATRELTTQICAEVVVGADLDGSGFREAVDAFLDAVPLNGRTRWLSRRYLKGRLASARLRRMCEQRMRSGCAPDTLLGQLVDHAPDERTRRAIPREILAVLVAARETTAAFLLWTMVETALDAGLRDAVRAELGTRHAGNADLLDRTAHPALHALVQRVAQLHSPNMLALRRLALPSALGGHRLPEGALVAYSPSLNSLSAAQLCRHVTASGRAVAAGSPGQSADSLAFGYGVRACPGKRLSELVAITLVATVLQRWTPRIRSADLMAGVRFLPLRVPRRPVRLVLEDPEVQGHEGR